MLVHLGNGETILEMDEGFWDFETCIEYANKINGEAYCVPIEVGK